MNSKGRFANRKGTFVNGPGTFANCQFGWPRCRPALQARASPPSWLQAEKSQVETTVRRISHQLNRLEIKRPEIKRCRRLKRPPVESAGEGPRKLSADARRLGA